MPTRSALEGVSVQTGLATGSTTSSTTVNGTGVDLSAFPGWRVMLVGFVGTRTDGTYTFSLEQSDDNSTFAAITPMAGSVAVVNASNTRRSASYTPTKRYVRAVLVSATVTSGATGTGALIVLVSPGA
ncbi:MAG TPA: hypothetical protein VF244_10475 [Acidimicrobiales bacterium]